MSESLPLILLDVSRTVARARLPQPTGIDRVERAYIRWVSTRGAWFLAGFDGHQHLLDAEAVKALLQWIECDGPRPALDLRARMQIQRDRTLRAAQSLARRSAIAVSEVRTLSIVLRHHLPSGGHYLNVGHDNLTVDLIDAVAGAGLKTSVLIHDTIPLDHPEFARRGTPEKFAQKLNAASQADLMIANSIHTAERLKAHGLEQSTVVAPLGIEPLDPIVRTVTKPPTFVTLGTIEPRKNHALLLSIWQQLWNDLSDASPSLILLGRRGWENQSVFRMLDTAPMMGRTVIEAGTPGDRELAEYLGQATALLFPSLAEGYGLPLAEALEAGAPCIASDLPSLREVGVSVPEYLAPDDIAGWAGMIREYCLPNSTKRRAQLQRLQNWSPPNWQTHFDIVENAIETILVHSGQDV